MICKHCGKTIRDDARFCVYCGKLVSSGKVCPKCGWTTEENGVFCQQCGTLLKAQSVAEGQTARTQQPVESRSEGAAKPASEVQPATYKMVTLFKGEVKNGPAMYTNELNVFPDRLEYIPKGRKDLGPAFGLVGMALSAAVKPATTTIWMKDIQSANLGNYRIGFTSLTLRSLILHMKNGKAYTLVPGDPDSGEAEEILKLIQAAL